MDEKNIIEKRDQLLITEKYFSLIRIWFSFFNSPKMKTHHKSKTNIQNSITLFYQEDPFRKPTFLSKLSLYKSLCYKRIKFNKLFEFAYKCW